MLDFASVDFGDLWVDFEDVAEKFGDGFAG